MASAGRHRRLVPGEVQNRGGLIQILAPRGKPRSRPPRNEYQRHNPLPARVFIASRTSSAPTLSVPVVSCELFDGVGRSQVLRQVAVRLGARFAGEPGVEAVELVAARSFLVDPVL